MTYNIILYSSKTTDNTDKNLVLLSYLLTLSHIKRVYPDISIIMGGPNIRYEHKGIKSFLEVNDFVDVYITFEGEIPVTTLLRKILCKYPSSKFTAKEIRGFDIDSCFSLVDGTLKGQHSSENKKNLDYIPSPYQTGLLDDFLIPEFIPLFESNRGCPHTCSYCTWGSNYAPGKPYILPENRFDFICRDVFSSRDGSCCSCCLANV